jgi:hypothetical protein
MVNNVIIHPIVVVEYAREQSVKVTSMPMKYELFIMFVLVSTCTDNVKNQNETDTDCGGSMCPKCLNNKMCNTSSDCVSAVCNTGTCKGNISFCKNEH